MKIWLTFPDGGRGQVKVEPVGPDRYRLEETPIVYVEDAYLGDEIAVTADAGGELRWAGVQRKSPMRAYSWMLSQSIAASREMAEFRDAVTAAGGRWEQTFGGTFIAHLPPDAPFDPETRFAQVVRLDR
jgi:hypothetical protein